MNETDLCDNFNMKIVLESSDGFKFEVDPEIARISGLIRNQLKQTESGVQTIPIDTVDSGTLRRLLNWIAHHKDDVSEKEEPGNAGKPEVAFTSAWDVEFLNVNPQTLIQLILAADYLQIEELKILACQAFSDIINDKQFLDVSKLFKKVQAKFATKN